MKTVENVKNNLNGAARSAENFFKDGKKTADEKIDEVKGKAEDVTDKAKSKAEDVKNAAQSKAQDVKDNMEGDDFMNKVEKTASEYASETLAFIKKYSLYSAIGAAMVGLGIGYMIYRTLPDDKTKH
jgi:ElaB/YqjD/DUF883 family membrane-anchored ribosome-binding protein